MCRKTNHTLDRCWKIHGRPPHVDKGNKWKQQKGWGYAHVSTQQPIENPDSSQPKEFNKEEIEQPRVFLNTFGKTPGTCSLTYSHGY